MKMKQSTAKKYPTPHHLIVFISLLSSHSHFITYHGWSWV